MFCVCVCACVRVGTRQLTFLKGFHLSVQRLVFVCVYIKQEEKHNIYIWNRKRTQLSHSLYGIMKIKDMKIQSTFVHSVKCSNFRLAYAEKILKFNTFLFYFILGTSVCVCCTLTCFKYFNIIYLFKYTHSHSSFEMKYSVRLSGKVCLNWSNEEAKYPKIK